MEKSDKTIPMIEERVRQYRRLIANPGKYKFNFREYDYCIDEDTDDNCRSCLFLAKTGEALCNNTKSRALQDALYTGINSQVKIAAKERLKEIMEFMALGYALLYNVHTGRFQKDNSQKQLNGSVEKPWWKKVTRFFTRSKK